MNSLGSQISCLAGQVSGCKTLLYGQFVTTVPSCCHYGSADWRGWDTCGGFLNFELMGEKLEGGGRCAAWNREQCLSNGAVQIAQAKVEPGLTGVHQGTALSIRQPWKGCFRHYKTEQRK